MPTAVSSQVQEHYARGKSFYEAGDFASAEREFAEALRLKHQMRASTTAGSAPPLEPVEPHGPREIAQRFPGLSPGQASHVTGQARGSTAQNARGANTPIHSFPGSGRGSRQGVAVVEAPLFMTPSASGLTDVRELSRYRERLEGMLRDLRDRIGRLTKRELRYQQRWLESSHDAEEEQEVAALQSERKTLESERDRLEQLFALITQRLATVHYNQGVELAGRQRLTEAVDEFQLAVTLAPDDPDMQYNLAAALASRKQYRKAAEGFRRAVRLRPDDADAHYNLGVLYDRYLKEPQRAREHLEAYLRLAPAGADAEVVTGWLNVLGHKPPAD